MDLSTMERIRDSYAKILEEELKSRGKMEKLLNSNQIVMMKDRDSIEESENQCKYCTDLCYLSMIKCSEHTNTPVQSQEKTVDDTPSKFTNK